MLEFVFCFYVFFACSELLAALVQSLIAWKSVAAMIQVGRCPSEPYGSYVGGPPVTPELFVTEHSVL